MSYIKVVYYHPPYLTYIRVFHVKYQAGLIKHKLESKLPGEISKTSDTQMTQPLYQKVKKEESKKDDLKLNIQ